MTQKKDEKSSLPYQKEEVLSKDSWAITAWTHEVHKRTIYQIQVPVPNSLRWVNAYAIRSEQQHGYTVIDPGMRTPEAEQVWREAFQQLDMHGHGVDKIILTHYHPDHLGLAGWMQEQFHCPVYLSEVGYAHACRLWSEDRSMSAAMCECLERHGAPESIVSSIHHHMESFVPQVTPLPIVTLFKDGDLITIGGEHWLAIETHGHAPGHISLWNEADGSIIVGDHVLPRITPNVSFMPNSDPEPLQSFIQGLKQLEKLPVTLAFPGHRHPFSHFHARIADLLSHHEERLLAFQQDIVTPTTAYHLCVKTFGVPSALSIHQFRFAMGETLAHLMELKRRGLAKLVELDPKDQVHWSSDL